MLGFKLGQCEAGDSSEHEGDCTGIDTYQVMGVDEKEDGRGERKKKKLDGRRELYRQQGQH